MDPALNMTKTLLLKISHSFGYKTCRDQAGTGSLLPEGWLSLLKDVMQITKGEN